MQLLECGSESRHLGTGFCRDGKGGMFFGRFFGGEMGGLVLEWGYPGKGGIREGGRGARRRR